VRRIQGEVDGKVDSTMDLQAAWIVVRREKIERSRRTRFIFPSALLSDFEQRLGINSGLGVERVVMASTGPFPSRAFLGALE